MKKKRWILALIFVLLISLCGCSKPKSTTQQGSETTMSSALDPSNPVTVTLWHYYVGENQLALENAVSKFNQTIGMEKGVIVDVISKGSIAELEEQVTNSAKGIINSDPMPDMFSSYPDKAMEIDDLGMLVNLNDYFTEEEKSTYVDDFLADGLFPNDQFLLVPIVKSTELLYVNQTEWEAFANENNISNDILSTWEGVFEAAKTYNEWSTGKALLGFDSMANYVIITSKQLGLDILDGANQQAVLEDMSLRQIFNVYYQGMVLGYFDAVGKFRSDDIKSGDLVAYVGSSSSAAYFPTWIQKDNKQQDIDFLALSYPMFAEGTHYAIQQGAGMCISKSTEQKQEGAALFLKWFTEVEQNIEFAMTTGYLPVRDAAYESTDFDNVLKELKAGEKEQRNVANVYEIALHQITESNTYAAKPFIGSYNVRTILQSTMLEMLQNDRPVVTELRAQDLSDEEIIEALDMDAKYQQWVESITTQLEKLGIDYEQK